MRNLFDQYKEPENRLTHALMSCLYEDDVLLQRFVQWAIGESAPLGLLTVVEQSLPGEEDGQERTEEQRQGLPDGWIYNNEGWALLIESKINCPLTADQIARHRSTAQRRGYDPVYVLALVTEPPERGIGSELKTKRWTELYLWLKAECNNSDWANRLCGYMDVLETKLVAKEILTAGTLTTFNGIPFNAKNPFTYLEAKRVLRLAMEELRKREDLRRNLGVDPNSPGRGAITGKDSSAVWDFLRLARSAEAKNHTEFPHLTVGLHRDYMHAIVIVPNSVRGEFRRNLLGNGPDAFFQVFSEILTRFDHSFGEVKGAVPWVELIQRSYPNQRSEPFIDALLEFDLRTAFPSNDPTERSPKLQPQWLQSIYEAMTDRNANLQLSAGVLFPYNRCPDAAMTKILDHIAHAWLACSPLIERLLGSTLS